MSAPARRRFDNVLPPALGLFTLLAFFGVMEAPVQTNVITRYIVPPPSEILGSFGCVFVEEHIVSRFFFTFGDVSQPA